MDSSLEHTKWNCKYHIVWAPKFRRKIIYGKYKREIGAILRRLCEYKHVEIVEANACVDHVHMCLKIPPKYSVSSIMGYLKGKSSLMIFEQFANLKYKYGNRHFWCKGYYVSTVGINEQSIVKYIREQEKQDQVTDQLSLLGSVVMRCEAIGLDSGYVPQRGKTLCSLHSASRYHANVSAFQRHFQPDGVHGTSLCRSYVEPFDSSLEESPDTYRSSRIGQ